MGGLFTKSKKHQSRVTDQDRAVLQLKQQRDRLKQYQKRIERNLESDRQLAKRCLQAGRKERAKLLLRKKKYQENLLTNTDKQLENLEKLTHDLEFAQIELQVLDGLKQGNAALKKVHEVLNIDDIEKIMDETREGIEKQNEIDALLSEALTEQDEDDVLAELEELSSNEIKEKLPEVPINDLPKATYEEEDIEKVTEVKSSTKEKSKKVLLEA